MGGVMDRLLAAIFYCCILTLTRCSQVNSANVEVDALGALKSNLADPNGVLQNWDTSLVNPCAWFHVTCKDDYVKISCITLFDLVTDVRLLNFGIPLCLSIQGSWQCKFVRTTGSTTWSTLIFRIFLSA